ncbi:MAG: hypothetical protein WB239_05310 [Acidimicrobiia bacterium]
MKPQIYIYTSMDAQADYVITQGDIEIITVNWAMLAQDAVFYSDTDREAARMRLTRIADPEIRKQELDAWDTEIKKLAAINKARQQSEKANKAKLLTEARQLLREAGELP